MTAYKVLRRAGQSDDWEVIDEVDASSAAHAVRLAAADLEGGTFVAVPARSWNPVLVQVVTQTRMVLS